jgi:hypothetical protein
VLSFLHSATSAPGRFLHSSTIAYHDAAARSGADFEPVEAPEQSQTRAGFRRGLSSHTGGPARDAASALREVERIEPVREILWSASSGATDESRIEWLSVLVDGEGHAQHFSGQDDRRCG